jgi:hypothetical protein
MYEQDGIMMMLMSSRFVWFVELGRTNGQGQNSRTQPQLYISATKLPTTSPGGSSRIRLLLLVSIIPS